MEAILSSTEKSILKQHCVVCLKSPSRQKFDEKKVLGTEIPGLEHRSFFEGNSHVVYFLRQGEEEPVIAALKTFVSGNPHFQLCSFEEMKYSIKTKTE